MGVNPEEKSPMIMTMKWTSRMIADYLLVREVDIVARYGDVKCTVLTDKVALSTLTSVANGNVNQIKEICQHCKCFIQQIFP